MPGQKQKNGETPDKEREVKRPDISIRKVSASRLAALFRFFREHYKEKARLAADRIQKNKTPQE